MRDNYYKDKKNMYISFFIIIIIYVLLITINYKEYKSGIEFQEELLGKKLYSIVSIRNDSIEERIKREIENMKFIQKNITNKGYNKLEMELLLNQEIESVKEFVTAYIIYKSGTKDVAIYSEERALRIGETIYNESIKKDKEVYLSEFKLTRKAQYMGVAIKVDKNITLVAVYNFKYISEKFIENGGNVNYTGYFILDRYGNIVFDYDREKIGENIFVINSENESIKKKIKKIIEKESGIDKYNKIEKNKKIDNSENIIAWKSFEILDKKIIICGLVSGKEMEKVISKLKKQNKYNYYIINILFISLIVIIYLYFKRDKECKINNIIKDERDNLEFVINESKSIFWEYYPEEKKYTFLKNFMK
jgi:hypothetical protein